MVAACNTVNFISFLLIIACECFVTIFTEKEVHSMFSFSTTLEQITTFHVLAVRTRCEKVKECQKQEEPKGNRTEVRPLTSLAPYRYGVVPKGLFTFLGFFFFFLQCGV